MEFIKRPRQDTTSQALSVADEARRTQVARDAALEAAAFDSDTAARAYAMERKARFLTELSENPLDDVSDVLGHMIDDIVTALMETIAAVEALGCIVAAAAIRAKVAKIQQIKADIPKPDDTGTP